MPGPEPGQPLAIYRKPLYLFPATLQKTVMRGTFFALFLVTSFFASAQKSSCDLLCDTRRISCYDIEIQAAAPSDPKKYIGWYKLFALTKGYIAALYNTDKEACLQIVDQSSAFMSGNGFADTSRPHVPWKEPGTGLPVDLIGRAHSDYHIYGTVVPEGNDYKMQLVLTTGQGELVKESSWLTIHPDTLSMAGMAFEGNFLLLDLKTVGSGSTSLVNIIAGWEMKKMQKSGYQLKPNFELKSAALTAKPGETMIIPFKVKDCNGLDVAKEIIELSAPGCKLKKNTVNTDAAGMAYIELTAPDKEGDVPVHLKLTYQRPGGPRKTVNDGFTIKVKKQKETVSATIKVKGVTTSEETDEEGKIISKREDEFEYSSDMEFRLLTENISRLAEGKQKLSVCGGPGMCVLSTGSNNSAGLLEQKKVTPVTLTLRSNQWTSCEKGLTHTYKSDGGGSLTDYTVNASISVEQRPQITDPELVPLVKENYYIRLYLSVGGIYPNINPAAPRPNSSYYDCIEKKWAKTDDSKYGVSVPNSTPLNTPKKDVTMTSGQTLFTEPVFAAREILNYLQNPTGGKTFSLKGKLQHKENNTLTTTDVWVTLVFH
jgi:hypothetical protein